MAGKADRRQGPGQGLWWALPHTAAWGMQLAQIIATQKEKVNSPAACHRSKLAGHGGPTPRERV